MKISTLSFVAGLCAATLTATAADTNSKDSSSSVSSSSVQPRVPAAKGPALELAIEAARIAIDTCAADGGQTVAASVVDSAGVLKALLATDGTSPRGVTSSTNKAVTALKFKIPTSQLGEQAKTDKTLADKIAADTNLNARPGGVLLKVGDEIIGAIGVGGGKTDEPCALAGVQKIQSRLK
ncbi:MAG: heme-binding protein [Pseudomonadota bacterium]